MKTRNLLTAIFLFLMVGSTNAQFSKKINAKFEQASLIFEKDGITFETDSQGNQVMGYYCQVSDSYSYPVLSIEKSQTAEKLSGRSADKMFEFGLPYEVTKTEMGGDIEFCIEILGEKYFYFSGKNYKCYFLTRGGSNGGYWSSNYSAMPKAFQMKIASTGVSSVYGTEKAKAVEDFTGLFDVALEKIKITKPTL